MIDEIVNYQMPHEHHANEVGFKGHREEELISIYTALFAKVLELSPRFRSTGLYIHGDNPHLLEMFIETESGGMLIKMHEAIDHGSINQFGQDPVLADCILMGKERYTLGENFAFNTVTQLTRIQRNATPFNMRLRAGRGSNILPDFKRDRKNQFGRFYVGAYGFTLPAPMTESKFNPRPWAIRVPHPPTTHDGTGGLADMVPKLEDLSFRGEITLYATKEVSDENPNEDPLHELNIVTHSDRGLVYKRDHDILEGFDVAVLYECDLGNVHAQFKRVERRSPSGWLELHVRAESDIIRHGFRVKNEPNHGPQDTRPSRGKLTPIFMNEEVFTLSGKIDYKTWWELVRSKEKARDNSRSTLEEYQRILGLAVHFDKEELEAWDREVIGLTNAGQIVFGYARKHGDEYEYALLKMGHSTIFDSENLVTVNTIAKEPEIETTSDREQLPTDRRGRIAVDKWLAAGRIYCAARNQILDESSINSIFTAYVNSGAEVTEEDMEDFSRIIG